MPAPEENIVREFVCILPYVRRFLSRRLATFMEAPASERMPWSEKEVAFSAIWSSPRRAREKRVAGASLALPAHWAMPSIPATEVLDFWFGPPELRGKARPEWFRKDEKFDAEIRRRFVALHASAALGEREAWRAEPRSMLALVIVLDQFSRNLYRGDARAFAQDPHALACARRRWPGETTPTC